MHVSIPKQLRDLKKKAKMVSIEQILSTTIDQTKQQSLGLFQRNYSFTNLNLDEVLISTVLRIVVA